MQTMKYERVLEEKLFGKDKLEIVELTDMRGAKSGREAEYLFYMKQAGVTMKFVRATLNGGTITTEAGALYYSKGNIENRVDVGGVGGVAKKMFKSALTQEAAFNPEYTGFGTVVLEPTFAHYIMLEIENESIIVDKGLYYCSIGNIKVKPVAQSNFSSAVIGGEGIFQTQIEGTGVVVLSVSVPLYEIEMYDLKNEKMQVDGNFAILRSSSIRFSVQKSARSLIASALGGEGFLQTFEGTGMVWIAPTSPVYTKMAYGGMEMVNLLQGSSNNRQ